MNDGIQICQRCGLVLTDEGLCPKCDCEQIINTELPYHPALTYEQAKELTAQRGKRREELGGSLSRASADDMYKRWYAAATPVRERMQKPNRDFLATLTATALMLMAVGLFIGSWLGE